MKLEADWGNTTGSAVEVGFDQLEQRWEFSLGAQETHILRDRIWEETGGLRWRLEVAAAAGLEGVELAEGVAVVSKGLHWSLKLGLSWRDEPQKWQKKRMRMRKWRKQKGVCEEFLRMMLSWLMNSRCWSCFWYLSQPRMKMMKKRRNREAE